MTFTHCPWLVEQLIDFDGVPADVYYDDGPVTEIVECGADIAWTHEHGCWACADGHVSYAYTSPCGRAEEAREVEREAAERERSYR